MEKKRIRYHEDSGVKMAKLRKKKETGECKMQELIEKEKNNAKRREMEENNGIKI